MQLLHLDGVVDGVEVLRKVALLLSLLLLESPTLTTLLPHRRFLGFFALPLFGGIL